MLTANDIERIKSKKASLSATPGQLVYSLDELYQMAAKKVIGRELTPSELEQVKSAGTKLSW